MTPLTHPAKKLTRWTPRSRTWGSPTCSRRSLSINPNFLICWSYTSQFCPKLNLIKDKIPVLGLNIVERQVQLLTLLSHKVLTVETEYSSQEIAPSLSHSFVERKGIIIFPNQQSNSEFELCFQRNHLAAFLSSSVNEFSTLSIGDILIDISTFMYFLVASDFFFALQ